MMIHMKAKKFAVACFTAALLVSPTFAAENAQTPLPAGKPAGTKEAALQMGGVWVVLGLVAVAGAIAAIVSNTQSSSTTGTSS
jgi:hypothetical protein